VSGAHGSKKHGGIETFELEYHDGHEWVWYVTNEDEEAGVAVSALTNKAEAPQMSLTVLDPPIRAKMIRLRPTKWSTKIALRADLRGCKASNVVMAGMELSVHLTDVIPGVYKDKRHFRDEVATRVTRALKTSFDQVDVANVVGSGSNVNVLINFLPKAKGDCPHELLKKLKKEMGDSNSSLTMWMDSLETSDRTHCSTVNCNSNGKCFSGKCFCFENWEFWCAARPLISVGFEGKAEPDSLTGGALKKCSC